MSKRHDCEEWCDLCHPPTPDPRERGVNYAAMMAARDENERDAARVVDAYLADRGVRWSPGAAQMAADLLALEALRAPAPSEAVACVDVVCDGPPGPSAGRFVECEDANGKSVCAGEWHERPDGLWALRIYTHPAPARGVTVTEAMVERFARAWDGQKRLEKNNHDRIRAALTAAHGRPS